MARPPKVSKETLSRLIYDEGLTFAEAADRTKMSVIGVKQAAKRYGLVRTKYMDHSWALPWKVREAHSSSKPATYLRRLSRIAQGGEVAQHEASTVFRWANDLVSNRLDLDYNPEAPPNEESIQGGFFVKPADPSNWHLQRVLSRATARYVRKGG